MHSVIIQSRMIQNVACLWPIIMSLLIGIAAKPNNTGILSYIMSLFFCDCFSLWSTFSEILSCLIGFVSVLCCLKWLFACYVLRMCTEPTSIIDDERAQLQQQIQELQRDIITLRAQRDEARTVNEAYCQANQQRRALPGRIQDLEFHVNQLAQERDNLRTEVERQRSMRAHNVPMNWVHQTRYQTDGSIPTARPWPELLHDEQQLKHAIAEARRSGSNDQHRLQQELDYVQRQKTRQCRLVDYVAAQMAGGEQFRAEFLEHVITKGPCKDEYLAQLDHLNGLPKSKLMEAVKESLVRYSGRRGRHGGQSAQDREVAKAVYSMFLSIRDCPIL